MIHTIATGPDAGSRPDWNILKPDISEQGDTGQAGQTPSAVVTSDPAVCDKHSYAGAETLYGVDAFRDLTIEQRQTLARLCHCRRFKAGRHVVNYSDHSREVYFVISGQLQAITFSVTGKQVTFQNLGAGEMFGELSAIDGQPRSAFVIALSDAVVCSMAHNDFWQTLKNYPEVSAVTLHRLTGMIRNLCDRIFQISALPVKERIHVELLRLAVQHMVNDNRAIISPAPTHTDIASYIGTHREAVSREINELRKPGIVGCQNNPLIIEDVNRLRKMVQQATGLSVADQDADL